jgi:hypothetical protein
MADLIPHYAPRLIETDGQWTVWEHRGAIVRACGIHNLLNMPGHPLHGTYQGHLSAWWPLIDHWLDHGGLPAPYVWPRPG